MILFSHTRKKGNISIVDLIFRIQFRFLMQNLNNYIMISLSSEPKSGQPSLNVFDDKLHIYKHELYRIKMLKTLNKN